MNILIVDDEQLARERLRRLLIELSFLDGDIMEAPHGLAALKFLERTQIDVILLDIRMPVMDGLETARHLFTHEHPPAIIFTTSYEQHALEAFVFNAVDYLLKPIRKTRLEKALNKVGRLNQMQIKALQQITRARVRQYISARQAGDYHLVPVIDIHYFKATEKYVVCYWSGGELLLSESLKSLENEFADQFLRVHRNALVQKKQVIRLERHSDGESVILKCGALLAVSRRHLVSVKNTIKTMAC